MKSASATACASSSTRRRRFNLQSPYAEICLSSASHLGPCVTQTCHAGFTLGTVGSPPTGSLLCPGRGSAQNEPGCWSNLMPLPGTPLPGTGASSEFSRSRTRKFTPTPVEGGGGNSLLPPPTAVMDMTVCKQRPSCNLHPTFWAVHITSLSLPEVLSCPCRPPLVRFLGHQARRMAWLACHAKLLPCVCPEAQPVDKASEDVKLPL